MPSDIETIEKIRSELDHFSISDYFRKLKYINDNIAISKNKPIRVAILRSYTVEMIEPMLKLRLILEGYNPDFFGATSINILKKYLTIRVPYINSSQI